MTVEEVCEALALTNDQKKMVVEAIGDQSDFPKMTNNIFVNHAVDCYMEGEIYEMDVSLYKAELKST